MDVIERGLGMRYVFWLVPGRLAGRPGPNRAPWDLREIKAAGIDAVLTLNDGEGCERAELEDLGLDYLRVPFPRPRACAPFRLGR